MVTLGRGRRRHLERQALAVGRLDPAPDGYLVVAMDEEPPVLPGARVAHRPIAEGEPLPLAAARNQAIAQAGDADLVVLLDADCLPEPGLLAPLVAAAARWPDDLLAGPVGRLAPMAPEQDAPSPQELAAAREVAALGPRPVPVPGDAPAEARMELFWSLSFAVRPATHARIGGFDEGYVGYGAEDTDYAWAAREAGVGLRWIGGAWAHHQHHPISSPPVEHLDDIVRNASRFRARWGTWPMEGWLRVFAERGLVDWDPAGERLERCAQPQPPR